jgi:hypothetical protein
MRVEVERAAVDRIVLLGARSAFSQQRVELGASLRGVPYLPNWQLSLPIPAGLCTLVVVVIDEEGT